MRAVAGPLAKRDHCGFASALAHLCAVLYRTPIGLPRILRWLVLYAALMPVALLLFGLFYALREGPTALQEQWLEGLPWDQLLLTAGLLGLALTAMATWQSARNNRRWHAFFRGRTGGHAGGYSGAGTMDGAAPHPADPLASSRGDSPAGGPAAALADLGFQLDRYGLHGWHGGYPVSLHYEHEMLGAFAVISVYAPVSDDVDTLRRMGAEAGQDWFFRFDALEHMVDPPFGEADWPACVHRATDKARALDLIPNPTHPWLPSSTRR